MAIYVSDWEGKGEPLERIERTAGSGFEGRGLRGDERWYHVIDLS